MYCVRKLIGKSDDNMIAWGWGFAVAYDVNLVTFPGVCGLGKVGFEPIFSCRCAHELKTIKGFDMHMYIVEFWKNPDETTIFVIVTQCFTKHCTIY